MIAADRLKAFLDDLAVLCVKHRIELFEDYDGEHDCNWIGVRELGPEFCGVATRSGWLEVVYGDNRDPYDNRDIFSLDVSTITAHQRIALAKSLRDTAASLPAGPDIPVETTGVDAVTDQTVTTCNTTEARNFVARAEA